MLQKASNADQLFKGKQVAITGGLGFIGSNLAQLLYQHGARIRIIDAGLPEYGGSLVNLGNIASHIDIHNYDLRDANGLEQILQDTDYVFALAGQSSHIDSMHDPVKDLQINTVTTVNLLEAARKACPNARFVYASTRQVYGKPDFLPVDESHRINPVDVNGINKLAAEQYYQLYGKLYGLKHTVLRLTNTYGPRMHLESNSKGFVGIFIRQALRREPIKIFGDGEQRRDFNYVDDVCDALCAAVLSDAAEGKIFNLGFERHYSLLEFTRVLTEIADTDFALIPFPPEHKAIDIGDYYGSYKLFHAATGWTPRTDVAEGIKRTVAFFREQI